MCGLGERRGMVSGGPTASDEGPGIGGGGWNWVPEATLSRAVLPKARSPLKQSTSRFLCVSICSFCQRNAFHAKGLSGNTMSLLYVPPVTWERFVHCFGTRFLFYVYIQMCTVKTRKATGAFHLGNWKDRAAHTTSLKPDSISQKGKKEEK